MPLPVSRRTIPTIQTLDPHFCHPSSLLFHFFSVVLPCSIVVMELRRCGAMMIHRLITCRSRESPSMILPYCNLYFHGVYNSSQVTKRSPRLSFTFSGMDMMVLRYIGQVRKTTGPMRAERSGAPTQESNSPRSRVTGRSWLRLCHSA